MAKKEKPNKAKIQTPIYDAPEVYKVKHRTGGIILSVSSITVLLFSIMTMLMAVYQITPFLVAVGIVAELSNAAVLYTSIREMHARVQVEGKGDFLHLSKIGFSGINYFPILIATYIFWFGLVGYCAYTSAEKRTRGNTEGVKSELSDASTKLNAALFSLSSQEKKRKNAIDSLEKSLSLCRNKIEPLTSEWGNRDEWVKNQYYYPRFRPLESERKSLEKSLKEQRATIFTTETKEVFTLEARLTELRAQIQAAEKTSNNDKYLDFWTHIILMLVSAAAVGYATFLKVRFDLFCGVGLDSECICTDTPKEPSRTQILTEALQDVSIQRQGEHGKIESEVTLSTFLNWKSKANVENKPFGKYYKEALKQLGRRYIISESEGGNKRLPKLVKK